MSIATYDSHPRGVEYISATNRNRCLTNCELMFQMSMEDKEFAVQYYYDNLIRNKDISWDEYIRTMKLFFFKEYSEWVYFARSSNDFTKPEYEKYYAKCKLLANDLGCYEEVSK